MSLLSELKRRNVFRVATFYAVAGWVLLQAGDLLFNALGVPTWAIKLLLGLLLLGFPLAIFFAWVYELTPEGLKREHEVHPDASITAQTANKLNVLIAVLLVVAIGLVTANWYGHRNDIGAATAPHQVGQAASDSNGQAGKGRAGRDQASIAVLPFVNMSDEKANEYFSDGLTEELLNVLANVPGLRVIARTSSFAYKGKDVKIADVARDLAVDHVLEGSVRKSGNKVRITTQLIRASDSSHLWSETYDRNLDDIFAVQDEISKQVVDSLKLKLLPERQTQADIGGTHDPKAYEAYLLGRHLMSEGGQAEAPLRAALQSFDDAIKLDPDYAQAYVGKSTAQFRLASNAYDRFDVGFAEARKAAQDALDRAPHLAEGLVALAQVQATVDGDIGAAVISARRALQLNPGSELVQRLCSGALSSVGDHAGAIRAAQAAVALDPISADATVNLAGILLNARRYVEAEAAARRALMLGPDRAGTPAALSVALLMQGQYDEAGAAVEKESVTWSKITGRALVLAKRGQTDAARRELVALQNQFKDDASYQYAQIEAQLGDKDAAMRWLQNAQRVHDPGLTSGINVDPLLDPLRDDPRFQKMLLELGFVKTS
jgi:TolB-like protein/Tfp pilus assembly protein PilF